MTPPRLIVPTVHQTRAQWSLTLDCFGCDFTGLNVIFNPTQVSSHELCEAITDAD